ncbi:hypothetical protein J7I97_30170, partial [Streptomyces sp. ISL-87]|uniref:hypothetical protein n=1 Tax=Streptomyces sp. ISL-87 TaxID=2819188 RepID=UPI001C174498|nr:hypothetical protein [Streptomyces sp. ISL-87]
TTLQSPCAGGAWGAAVVAFRAARYQADRQADSQHQQWLRQVRRETYSAFLESANACLMFLYTAPASRDLPMDEAGQAERLRRRGVATAEQQRFEAARATLNLEAPAEIRDLAAELAQHFTALFEHDFWIWGVPRDEGRAPPFSLLRPHIQKVERVQELMSEIQRRCRESLTGNQ